MLTEKLSFHFKKWCRIVWFNLKYRINKWKVIDGIYLPVYLKYGYSVLRFIDDGTYEGGELRIVKKKLSSDDIVLELGTGIGFITTVCAKIIGSDKVYSFEANSLMKPVTEELFAKNQVTPNFSIALLASAESQGEFYAQNNFLASSEKAKHQKGTFVKVPVLDLNDTISKIKPTYLLMDIEGNELDILKIIDFQTIQKVQFELHPQYLNKEEIEFIFKKLETYSFKMDKSVSKSNYYFFEKKL